MRKGLLGVVVLLVAIVLLVPFGMGYWVKDYYPQLLKIAETESGAKIKLVSFKRGWFSSQGIISVTVVNPNDWRVTPQPTSVANKAAENKAKTEQKPKLTFVVQQKIEHGPIVLAGKKLMLARAYISTQLVDPAIQVQHATVITLNGTRETRVQIPAIAFSNTESQTTIFAQGIDFNADATADQKAVKGSLDIKTLDVNSPQSGNQIQQLRYQFDIAKSPEGFWLGTHSMQTPKIALSIVNDKPETTIVGLDGQASVIENKGRLTYEANYGVSDIVNQDKTYGASQVIFAVKDLDAAALDKIKRQLQALGQVSNPSPSQVFSFYPLIMDLLNKGVSINVQKVDINTAWGKLLLQADIKLPQQQTNTLNVSQLVKSLDVNLHFKAPAKLVQYVVEQYKQGKKQEAQPLPSIPSPTGEETPAAQAAPNSQIPQLSAAEEAQRQIALWVKNGELIPEGDSYILALTYQNNQLLINGKAPATTTPAPVTAPTTPVAPIVPAPAAVPASGTVAPATTDTVPAAAPAPNAAAVPGATTTTPSSVSAPSMHVAPTPNAGAMPGVSPAPSTVTPAPPVPNTPTTPATSAPEAKAAAPASDSQQAAASGPAMDTNTGETD